MDNYRHFVRPSTDSVIRAWFVDGITDNYMQGDILVDDNGPRQFTKVMTNDKQQFLYKLEGGAIVFRTQAELDAEISALPPQPPSDSQRLASMESALLSLMGL